MDTNLKVLCGLSHDLATLCLYSSTQTYTDMLATHPVAVIISVANHVVCDPEDCVPGNTHGNCWEYEHCPLIRTLKVALKHLHTLNCTVISSATAAVHFHINLIKTLTQLGFKRAISYIFHYLFFPQGPLMMLVKSFGAKKSLNVLLWPFFFLPPSDF